MKIPDIFDKAAMPKCLYQWRASYFEMKKRPYGGFRELLFCFPQSLRFDRKPFQLISDFHMAAVSAAFFVDQSLFKSEERNECSHTKCGREKSRIYHEWNVFTLI